MDQSILLDIAPNPAGGALLAVVLLVVGFVVLLAIALVLFLWYRKRRLGTVEMIRSDAAPAAGVAAAQPSKANQP